MSGSFALRSVHAVLAALLVLGSLTVLSSQRPGAFTALSTDPQTPSILYAGTPEKGVLKSEDGGATWKPTGLGNARVTSLAIELENPRILYAGTLGGGVYKSVDAGTTWRASNVGLRALNVTELTIAPQSPVVLYAVIADVGVFKSTDGAATWTRSSLTCVAEDCANGLDDDCDGFADADDVDCGEPIYCGFDSCPPGYVCGFDSYCVNHCFDGERNGTEGDVDCGGDCVMKCQNGKTCGLNYDCESGVCYYGVCTAALPPPATLSSLNLSPASVMGSSASTGTVIMTGPAAAGTTVSLSSSHPGVAIVPAIITVTATSTTASFTVSTTSVALPTSVTISAYFGGVTKSATLTLNPAAARDGKLDLLWHHQTTGQIAGWRMNGTQLIEGTLLTPSSVPDTTWKCVGTGDLDGDGQVDLVWQNMADGRSAAWLMNGLTLRDGTVFSIVPDLQWKIRSVGDLNGDNKADLFWQHEGTGQLAVWLMNGLTVINGTLLTPSLIADLQWKLVGTGDFDRNGSRDLVFHHQGDGRIALWFMNGTTLMTGSLTTPASVPDLNWKIRGVGDLNADGNPDFILQNRGDGRIAVWLMNGLNLIAGTVLSPSVVVDTNWHVVGPR